MSVVGELEKLAALRSSGAISDAEFQKLKGELLASKPDANIRDGSSKTWADVKLREKWWFQLMLAIFITPLGLLSLAFNKSYYKKRDRSTARRSIPMKLIFSLLALFVWCFTILQISELEGQGGTMFASDAPECDSNVVRDALKDAIENSVAAKTENYRLLDLRNFVTISTAEQNSGDLKCNANFILNSGEEVLGYTVESATGGMVLVTISEPFEIVPIALESEPPVLESAQETRSSFEDISDEEPAAELLEIKLRKRPELSENDLIGIQSYLTASGMLADRNWSIIASTQIYEMQVAVLLEAPEIGVEEDCHGCAPPLTLLTLDLSDEISPAVISRDLDFAEIGAWGRTSDVVAVTTPDNLPAFAFDYGFSNMGETVSECFVYSVESGGAEQYQADAGSAFNCAAK